VKELLKFSSVYVFARPGRESVKHVRAVRVASRSVSILTSVQRSQRRHRVRRDVNQSADQSTA